MFCVFKVCLTSFCSVSFYNIGFTPRLLDYNTFYAISVRVEFNHQVNWG